MFDIVDEDLWTFNPCTVRIHIYRPVEPRCLVLVDE